MGNLAELKRLSLRNNELTGPIPPWLADRKQLTSLDLHGNKLTGAIPRWLGSLIELETLTMGGSQLTGPIPSELGNLAELKYLDLGSNQLSGPVPPELGNLHQLERLRLGGNRLTGPVPPEFEESWQPGGTDIEQQSAHRFDSADLYRTEQSGHVGLPQDRRRMPAGHGGVQGVGAAVEARGSIQLAVNIHGAMKSMYKPLNASTKPPSGDRWTRSGGWLEAESLARWHGVTTDSNGRVSGLDLSGNGCRATFRTRWGCSRT